MIKAHSQLINNGSAQTLLYLPGLATDYRLLDGIKAWNIISFDGFVNNISDIDPLDEILRAYNIHNVTILGWSLGAKIAVELAKKYPQYVRQLFLLSINPEFDSAKLKEFAENIREYKEKTLKKFYMETFYPDKSMTKNFLRGKICADYLEKLTIKDIADGISALATKTVLDEAKKLPPTIIFHGENDVVAPLENAEKWARENSLPFVKLKNAGHFILNNEIMGAEIDKPFHHFRCVDAKKYGEASRPQQASAENLGKMLPKSEDIKSIFEIGSGSGIYTEIIQKNYGNAKIMAVDLLTKTEVAGVNFSFCDIEREFPKNSDGYDLITANATLHWLNFPDIFFENCYENLNSGGILLYSYYTKNCYVELADVLKSVIGKDYMITAATFTDIEDILHLQHAVFGNGKLEVKSEKLTYVYEDLREMFKIISKSGTKGNREDDVSIWTPRLFKEAEQLFLERYGSVKGTFEIFYMKQEKS